MDNKCVSTVGSYDADLSVLLDGTLSDIHFPGVSDSDTFPFDIFQSLDSNAALNNHITSTSTLFTTGNVKTPNVTPEATNVLITTTSIDTNNHGNSTGMVYTQAGATNHPITSKPFESYATLQTRNLLNGQTNVYSSGPRSIIPTMVQATNSQAVQRTPITISQTPGNVLELRNVPGIGNVPGIVNVPGMVVQNPVEVYSDTECDSLMSSSGSSGSPAPDDGYTQEGLDSSRSTSDRAPRGRLGEEEKAERRKQQNKRAAEKYRMKAKEDQLCIQEKFNHAKYRNSDLDMELRQLKQRKAATIQHIKRHIEAKCGIDTSDPVIAHYISLSVNTSCATGDEGTSLPNQLKMDIHQANQKDVNVGSASSMTQLTNASPSISQLHVNQVNNHNQKTTSLKTSQPITYTVSVPSCSSASQNNTIASVSPQLAQTALPNIINGNMPKGVVNHELGSISTADRATYSASVAAYTNASDITPVFNNQVHFSEPEQTATANVPS